MSSSRTGPVKVRGRAEQGQSELKESRVGPGTSLQLSDREEKWMCLGSSINSTWETRKGRA